MPEELHNQMIFSYHIRLNQIMIQTMYNIDANSSVG